MLLMDYATCSPTDGAVYLQKTVQNQQMAVKHWINSGSGDVREDGSSVISVQELMKNRFLWPIYEAETLF